MTEMNSEYGRGGEGVIRQRLEGLQETVNDGLAQTNQALTNLQSQRRWPRIQPDVSSLYTGTRDFTRAETDVHWITALISVPGVKPELIVNIVELHDRIASGEQPFREEPAIYTSELPSTEPHDPTTELVARVQEANSRTSLFSNAIKEGSNAVNEHLQELPNDQRNDLNDSISGLNSAHLRIGQNTADCDWVVELARRPEVTKQTIVEVWDGVVEERARTFNKE